MLFRREDTENMYLEYRGHKGSVVYDTDKDYFTGKVISIENSNLSYEGKDIDELSEDFREVIDDYIDMTGMEVQ